MTIQVDHTQVGTLAVVEPFGNPGGGTRFLRALILSVKRTRPALKITLFGDSTGMRRDGIIQELTSAGVQVQDLQWVRQRNWKSRPLQARVAFKIQRRLGRADPDVTEYVKARLADEIARAVQDFDVAYFPGPYYDRPPRVDRGVVTTMHDLNFKYFFGAPIFSLAESLELDAKFGEWLEASTVVTSSRFMAQEIAHFYPAARPVPVIRLAPFAINRRGDSVAGSGVPPLVSVKHPYVLFPTQMAIHKGVGQVIAAQVLLRKRFPSIRLVLTGLRTEAATGRATAIGSVRGDPKADIIGLGYVSNEHMDKLIEEAAVVVNASLYESGNGPGLDAWSLGTPVAMSDIPPFREHLGALGVEAALFDPRDPVDIARKIADVLDHRDAWAEVAARSRAAIARRTWDHVAAEYLRVFDATYAEHRRG